ncbi:mRNA nuclease HepT [Candidatus Magnetomoraceae bacterium gMMP-1]
MNDIILNKKESIERCIKQIRIYYALPADTCFEEDYIKQDAIAMNLQRACEQCIDLANHIIKIKKLGLPKTTKESFQLLAQNKIIPGSLASELEKMVGFRNILVHEYQILDIQLMVNVIKNHLNDLLDFTNFILKEAA